MPPRRHSGLGIIAAVLASTAAISFVGGCEAEATQGGQLVVTFQTDMALPDHIDNVRVQLTRRGGVLHMDAYTIGGSPNDNPIPGSLAIKAGANPEPITITVAGSKNNEWRTYREIVTTVPRDRVAELRMPIQWLCNESAVAQVVTVPDGTGGQVSRVVQTCGEGLTCKAGTCVSNETDSSRLPTFDPTQLYGGAKEPEDGMCFDVVQCMVQGTTVDPDEDCTFEKPADENINVALRVAGGGICDSQPTTNCFVPLDGEDAEGWVTSADGTRIELPKAVCTRLAERKVLAVQTSSACETKTPALPACGKWSVVPSDRAIVPDPAGPAPTWPSAENFASVPASDTAEVCCPLMSEGDQLYTCLCTGEKDTPDAASTVYAFDMESARREMFPVAMHTTLASAVVNRRLYWAGYASEQASPEPKAFLFQLPLEAGATPTSTPGVGGLYSRATLLTDASGVHVMTSGLGDENEENQVVYLLHFSFSGDLLSMDPLGNRVVNQFTQDTSAFYAVVNVDEKVPAGQPFRRTSSVVRIDKQTHAATPFLNAQTLTLSDISYNGYLGAVSDGTDVAALYESQPTAGFENLQIGRVPSAYTAGASDLAPLYDIRVATESHPTSLRLLGVVDGAVFFARDERLTDRISSSVLVIPRGQTRARFVADFVGDLPVSGIAANSERVFWLNQSGRIFTLSREALAP